MQRASFKLLVVITILTMPRALAQEATQPDGFPDLTIPENAGVAELQKFINMAKKAMPRNGEQYQSMQTAIRTASRALLSKLSDKNSAAYQQAELDAISAAVSLMTFAGEDAKQKTVEKVHALLKSKDVLSESDVQMGIMAAAMLEMQPNKKPARDTYELLDELLKKDDREAMQSLRLNLQASIRKLNLLGSKFDLKAVALDGSKIEIDDYAGKFVVVDFFATWCKPCLIEMPKLKAHYQKYKSRGLEVIGISVDHDKKQLDKFLGSTDVPWPVIHDDEPDPLKTLQMRFGVAQLPTALLLNKEGTVVSLEARGSELNRLLQKLFEAPTLAPAPPESSDSSKATTATSDG